VSDLARCLHIPLEDRADKAHRAVAPQVADAVFSCGTARQRGAVQGALAHSTTI